MARTDTAATTGAAARTGTKTRIDPATWKGIVARFQKPSTGRAVWQIVNSLVPYILLWVLMFFSLSVSWWLTLPLAALAGAFLVRIFIILHDCGHGSFFESRTANAVVGSLAGVLTFTPYYHWTRTHSLHHATSSDLDRRGPGDIWTMTVQEYLEASRWKRFAYVLARNPVVLFLVAPLYIFLIDQRFPSRIAKPARTPLGDLDEPLPAGHGCGAVGSLRIQGVPGDPADGGRGGGDGRGLVCSTSSTSSTASTGSAAKPGTTPAGGAQGELVLQAPRPPAVVLRQHRLPPHPPPQPAHSELQPRALPPGRSAVPERPADYALRQPEVGYLPSLGRAARQAGWLPPPARAAPVVDTS